MTRATVFAVTGWLAAAAAATLTGLGALSVIGAGITGSSGEVYSQERIARELAVPPSPIPSSPPSSAPSAGTGSPDHPGAGGTGPAQDRRALSTPGGTVVARCVGTDVELISWVPAQGYAVSDVDRGPDDDAELTFSGPGGKFEVEVRCVEGSPAVTWQLDD